MILSAGSKLPPEVVALAEEVILAAFSMCLARDSNDFIPQLVKEATAIMKDTERAVHSSMHMDEITQQIVRGMRRET